VRLELIRSGGIAGLEERRSLDTAALEPNEAQEVEELVATADLDELVRRSPIRGRGADRFQYELRVEREGREQLVTVSEDQIPVRLEALFERIRKRGGRHGER
jgi:hypothetical protein